MKCNFYEIIQIHKELCIDFSFILTTLTCKLFCASVFIHPMCKSKLEIRKTNVCCIQRSLQYIIFILLETKPHDIYSSS